MQYQVEDDELLYNWKLGWPYSLFMESIPQLTRTEADLISGLAAWPWHLIVFKDAKDNAYGEADRRFTLGAKDDSHNDAFRHAYWNALLTTDIAKDFASEYTTSHEGIPGNPASREAMDLYNNEVGRRIAANNPGASHEELAGLIEQAIYDGELLVIDGDGNLAWSNEVPEGQCGQVDKNEAPLDGRPRDDFAEDTRSGQ